VLSLGDEIEVRVDEIDDKGKVSLSPASNPPAEPGTGDGEQRPRGERGSDRDRGDRGDRGPRRDDRGPRDDRGDRGPRRDSPSVDSSVATVSFEDAFDKELQSEFGDLGPAGEAPQPDRPPRSDRDRGPRRHR
jgi:polyribonucleotide nucleotidyltransferase